ncbi:YfiR family protein [Paraglaciecola sp.]|uniref:YfiR family protein n=1 Tax=Paraglaciecola sp. TaxID=1920173 RepID=UPI0030F46631
MHKLLLLLVFFEMPVAAQEPVVYQVKASYIYNFLQFVQFPDDNSAGEITVCILGENKFGSAIETLEGAAIPGAKIHIKLINNYREALEIAPCKVVYIVGEDLALSRKILGDIDFTQVLTIGESSEFIGLGGYIELFSNDDSIRFRLNKTLVDKTQFKVAAQLLSLGVQG